MVGVELKLCFYEAKVYVLNSTVMHFFVLILLLNFLKERFVYLKGGITERDRDVSFAVSFP